MDIRVYYEDTDCGGVVYYANYLRYFERARTEFLRDHGVDVAMWMDQGLLFTVAACQIRYHGPARYDDLLRVSTRVSTVRKVRFELTHEITRPADGVRIVTGTTTMACVADDKLARLPTAVLAVLQTAESTL